MITQAKAVILGLVVAASAVVGFLGGKWWYQSDEVAGFEQAHEAGEGLVEDNAETQVIYVDRIVTVERAIEDTNADDIECLTPDLVGLFNGNE